MQHVHAQRLLEVPEVGFDLPPLTVEFRDVGLEVTLRVEQGRGQRDDARPPAAFSDSEAQLPHGDCFRQSGPRLRGQPRGTLRGLRVFDELIMAAQALEPARGRQATLLQLAGPLRGGVAMWPKIDDLSLMDAKNPENPSRRQQREMDKRAKGAVPHQDVASR